jgi:hypothetical protein
VLGTVVTSPSSGSSTTDPDDTPGSRAPQRTDTTADPSGDSSSSSTSAVEATQAGLVNGPDAVAAPPAQSVGVKAKLATVFGERDRTEEVVALPVAKTRAVGIAETAPNQARDVATYGFVAAGAAFLLLMSYFADAWRRR